MFSKRKWLAAAVAVGAAIAACGGSSDDRDIQTGRSTEPALVAKRIADGLAAAKRTGDCDAVGDLLERADVELPCPPSKKLRERVRQFRVVDSAAYETAAIVEYRSAADPKRSSTALFHRNLRGQWTVTRFDVPFLAAVGTSDHESREGFDRAVGEFVRGVKERNCYLFRQNAATFSRIPHVICRKEFPTTERFRDVLARDPGARPRYQGGNRLLGFYRLDVDTSKPRSYTIAVAKTSERSFRPFLVLYVKNAPARPGAESPG